MTSKFLITTSSDTEFLYLVGKEIHLIKSLAQKLNLKDECYKALVVWVRNDAIRIRYKGELIWLPKSQIKIVSVEKKGLFDFVEAAE